MADDTQNKADDVAGDQLDEDLELEKSDTDGVVGGLHPLD